MTKRMMTAMFLTAAIALLVGIKVGGQGGSRATTASALPPASIPTFATDNLGRMAHFYVGGKYVGAPGKEQMDGAMYVEVWVPKQVRQPYPIVMFHGNGQTGAVFQQTPDGRPGWAYYLIDQGYVVYMVDYPARGRSPYVPGVDGMLGIRSATELSQIWTAPATSGGDFPRKGKYTQWPSNHPKKGMVGDPVFDNFIKGQMQFVNDQAALAVPAGIALLDAIGKPVILLTHSQGGGIGFDVAEKRSQFIAGMVSIEPGGPQIGNVDTAKV
ncbi:MAG TPA: hypothetical protein VKC35_00050, partial [Vicinamibacterales bacterium]|nr:hypothetical protein [Vicinamibacterales bacterium]